MDGTLKDIDELNESGVRFSITLGPSGGYLVKLGNYAREVTPTAELESLDEAVIWLRAHVALGLAS